MAESKEPSAWPRSVCNAAALSARRTPHHRNRKSAFNIVCYHLFLIHIRTWLSLVERLLWEQDAAGSNPVVRTTQRELTLAVGSLCVFLMPGWVCGILRTKQGTCFGEARRLPPVAESKEPSAWPRSVCNAAALPARRTPHHRNRGKAKMPQVRILSSGPRKKD